MVSRSCRRTCLRLLNVALCVLLQVLACLSEKHGQLKSSACRKEVSGHGHCCCCWCCRGARVCVPYTLEFGGILDCTKVLGSGHAGVLVCRIWLGLPVHDAHVACCTFVKHDLGGLCAQQFSAPKGMFARPDQRRSRSLTYRVVVHTGHISPAHGCAGLQGRHAAC